MHKQNFRKQIVFSSLLTTIAIMIIMFFCISMFKRYSPPSENNTFLVKGTVTEVYHAVPRGEVVVVMSNKESLKLVYPWGIQNLYSTIGYDINELADLLEGKDIEYRRTNDLPWAVEIYVGDKKINNNKLTTHQMILTRVGIIIIGLIMLAFAVFGEIIYLKSRHHTYQKVERKRIKKAKRELKLKAKETNK